MKPFISKSSIAQGRIVEIDLLRVIAIYYIVSIHHLNEYTGQLFFTNYDRMVTYLSLAILFYFSGYLIEKNLCDEKKSTTTFYFERLTRLYPLFAVALVGFYLCSILSAKEFFYNIILAGMLAPAAVYTLWFVSMLFVFYAIAPLCLKTKKWPHFLLIGLCIWCASYLLGRENTWLDPRLFTYWPLFFYGLAASRFNHANYTRINVVLISLVLFLISGYTYFFSGQSSLLLYSKIVFLCSLIAPILYLAHQARYFIERIPLLYQVSYASFCVYLFHRIGYYFMLGIYVPTSDIKIAVYLLVIALPLTILGSYFLQKIYDQFVFKRIASSKKVFLTNTKEDEIVF